MLLLARYEDEILGQTFVKAPQGLSASRQAAIVAGSFGYYAQRRALEAAIERSLRADHVADDRPAPSVSVIVCTRDRPADLARCLDSLERLRTRPIETVVVDNAPSTDAAEALCRSRPVRYVREPLPGQTRARNRGAVESQGEWLAFTDDDCVVDPAWLDMLPRASEDPLVGAVCGYIGPLELETPSQYVFEVHGGFQRHPIRRTMDPAQRDPVHLAASAGAGANMLIRRQALERVGLFAEFLGPGTAARSSDDKELFYRLLHAGYRIVYDPAGQVWHGHRRDTHALRRIIRDYGTSEAAYTLHLLLRYREWHVLGIWAWWLRHCLRDARRSIRDKPTWVPLWIPLAELAGAAGGPSALIRSRRSRRGIPPITLRDARGKAPSSEAEDLSRPGRSEIAVRGEQPDVTVALATYNRRESVIATLGLLAQQSLPSERFEVVVVVDGSTDGTADAVRALDTRFDLKVHVQENRGLAATRNQGAALAGKPVVAFLDDDIRPAGSWLAAHAAAHAVDGPDLVALGPYPPHPPEADAGWWQQQVASWWFDHFRRKSDPAHRWSMFDVIDGNLSIPLRLFNEVGRFDERFRGGRRQDYELGIRLLEREVAFRFAPGAFGWHEFDARFPTAERNAREEGFYDVLIARLHPHAASRLALVSLSPERPVPSRVARLRSVATVGRELAEPAGMRRVWLALTMGLLVNAYARGAREGAGGDEELADLLTAIADARLAEQGPSDGGSSSSNGPPPLDVSMSLGSLIPITAPLRPGEQWDTRALVEQLTNEGVAPIAVSAVIERLQAGEADAPESGRRPIRRPPWTGRPQRS